VIAVLPIIFIEPYKLGINIWAFQAAKALASPALNIIMYWLAKSFLVVLPILVVYMLLKRDMNVYTLVIAGILLYLISDVIKIITKEPRPCNITELAWINSMGCQTTYSFPSNHASVLTGLVFFLKNYKYVRVLYVVWLLLILFGRVYLGLHYFTDVLAGAALSLVVAYVLRRYEKRINALVSRIVDKVVDLHLVQK